MERSISRSEAFRYSVLLSPLAFTFHVMEEAPYFTNWVKRFINPRFTQSHYLSVHIAGIVIGLVLAGLLSRWPKRWFLFLYLSFFFLPAQFFNIFFHLGATIVYKAYSPGLFTALFLYPPVVLIVLKDALKERLIGRTELICSFFIAGCFHSVEVAHNVFYFGR